MARLGARRTSDHKTISAPVCLADSIRLVFVAKINKSN
jgi:hypothetical protein